MDLLDLAILALRIALVAVLYGFMLLVLRSARRSLQATRPGPAAASPSRPHLRLIVLAAGGSDLTAGQAVDIANGLTLGRAERAELVLTDSAVSAEHARVAPVGRDWVIRDLGSTNGTLVNGARVKGQSKLRHDDVVALGSVQFKVALRSTSGEGPR